MKLAILLACISLAAAQFVAVPASDDDDNMPPVAVMYSPNTPDDEPITSSDECADYGVPYCSRCENPGLRCYGCAWGNVLKINYMGCEPCDQANCRYCQWTSDAEEATECLECSPRYYMLEDTSCAPCGDNCLECTADACMTCVTDRFVFSQLDAKNCVWCGSACTGCNIAADDTTRCTGCIAGYYLDDGNCLGCQTFCDACTKPDNTRICSSCLGLTQLSDDSTACLPCGTGCTACSGQSQNDASRAACTACVANYYLEDDLCTPCMANCVDCDESGSCNECAEGYYRADELGSSCQPCSWRCRDCSDGTSCNECFSGYANKLATEVTCDRCPSNCLTCTVADAILGRCTSCASGFFRQASTGTCRPCSSNCLQCTDENNCRNCEDGYLRSTDDNACHLCPENCADGGCSYNATMGVTHCDACVTGFTPNDALEACVQCQEGCTDERCQFNATLSTTECICANADSVSIMRGNQPFRGTCQGTQSTYACQAGYYYDDTGVPTCTPCGIAGCIHCNSTGTIECLLCDSDGYETTPDQAICTACGPNCATCNNNGDCTSCVAGYGEVDNECRVCGSLCNACSWTGTGSTATSRCTDCRARSIRDTSNTANCLACSTACSSCTVATEGGTTCTTCQAGYELDTNGECQRCPDNCADCEFESGTLVCILGQCNTFYGRKTDKQCYECPSNCPTCSISGVEGEDDLICTECSTRYTMNSRLCTPCPSNCPSCTVVDGNVEGASAAEFYYLDSSSKTCQRCVANCRTCSSSSCSECLPGYGLSADRRSCVPCATLTHVENCALCTSASTNENSTCTDCISTHVLSDNMKLCTAKSPRITGACRWFADHPPECIDCDSSTGRFLRPYEDYYFEFPKLCVFECYKCGVGDREAETITSGVDTVCNKDPNDSDQVYDTDAFSDSGVDYPEFHNYSRGDYCFYGFCAVATLVNDDGRIRSARGCAYNITCAELEDSDEGGSADSDLGSQSVDDYGRITRCRSTGGADNEEYCGTCCDGNLCNYYFIAGSTAVSASLTMIILAVSYAISLI